MQAKLRKSSLINVFVIFALAGFWHFLYDFLPCGFIGAISPVNESPWEHAKLFFIPAIICYAVVYVLIGKKFPNYIFSHAVSLLIMPVFMLLLFYAYQLFFEETLAIDIINAFLTIALGVFVAYKLTISNVKLSGTLFYMVAAAIFLAMLAIYIVFTFWPPASDMFIDRETMTSGI